jgi:hypothetical protein
MATKPKTSDEDFNTKLLSIILYLFGTTVRNATPPAVIPTVSSRLNISTPDLDALWNLFYLWTDYYPKTKNRSTYQTVIKDYKNDTRTGFEKLWMRVCGDMKKSALTADDRVALYLQKRDEVPTDVQPKNNAPVLFFAPSIHGVHVLRIQNPDAPDSKAMPKGQKVYIEYHVGEPNLAEDKVAFSKAEITGAFIYKINHEPAHVGKTAYYRPYYITRTGKKGVRGKMISAVIF